MADRRVFTRSIKRNLERVGSLRRITTEGMKWKDVPAFLKKYPQATWGGKHYTAWVIAIIFLLISSMTWAYCSPYYFSYEYKPDYGMNKVCVYSGASGEVHLPFPVFQLCPLTIRYDDYKGICR